MKLLQLKLSFGRSVDGTMVNKQAHVIVISYDSFSQLDFEKAKHYPNLAKLIENGIYSTQLSSVYPSMTYVVHTTMVTGLYPDKHGIIHNYPFQPFVDYKQQAWHWYRSAIQASTIYDMAKEAGLKTASLMWPVSGGAKTNYNFPEIIALPGENQVTKILKNGSPLFCLNMAIKYGRHLSGAKQPQLDDFTTNMAVDTIKHKKPNLLLCHLIELDDLKHDVGIEHDSLEHVYQEMDQRIGRIVTTVQELGLGDQTSFMVLGDHGQFTIKKRIFLNQYLYEKGWIKDDHISGKKQSPLYFQSSGGAAYLHVDQNNSPNQKEIEELLSALRADFSEEIEAIFNREQLDSFSISPNISYMIEGISGVAFSDAVSETGQLMEDLESQQLLSGDHGYHPDKENYQCGFVLSGPAIKRRGNIGPIKMVDIAPTIANLLGIEFPHRDGSSVSFE